MHSSNHKSHASIASSLPWAADTTAAIRRGKLEISNPMLMPHKIPAQPGSRIDGGGHTYQISPTDTWPGRGPAPVSQDFNAQPLDENRAWNGSGTYNNSARTSAALTNTQQSMSSLPSSGSVGKGGGIRATFRKMFGSKRRRVQLSTGANDHRSNSVSLLNNPVSANHHPLRKPSLLFEELIRGRALNSHAPNTIIPEPTRALKNGVETFRPLIDGYSRRNSLPSVVLSSQEAQGLRLTLNNQGTGPDNAAPRKPFKKATNRSFIDSVKRRSRSADELRDMARSQNTLQAQERRLSDEIKYWRNSIVEAPIPSYTSSRQAARKEVEDTRSTSTRISTPPTRRSSEEVTARPQGFDFSGLRIGNVDASVEQRITTVEVKLVDLECAIANLQCHEVAQRPVLRKRPRRRKVLQEVSPQDKASSASSPKIIPQSSFDSFSTSSSASDNSQRQANEHRNSVANTLRPGTAAQSDASTAIASHPTQSSSEDEIARLVSILSREQEARQGLESQLKDMQKQINELRYPAVHRGPATPCHFSAPTSKMLDSPPISATRHTVLPFRTASPHLTLRMTAMHKENEGDETDTDDGFLDVYETPTEARECGFGIGSTRSPPLIGVV